MPRYRDVGDGLLIEEFVALGSPELEHFFSEDGPLAAAFPGYRPRAGQLEFSRAVEQAVQARKVLVAEAPCGVGKTFGYIVPIALRLARPLTHRRPEKQPPGLVVVTGNINLQEQLIAKDLPFLKNLFRTALKRDFSYAILKGWRNYVCLAAATIEEHQPTAYNELSLVEQNAEIQDWIKTTRTGDRSELSFEPPEMLWNRYAISPDACTKTACPFYSECFAFKARRTAAGDADVVITNYHFLWSHIQLASSGGISKLLPANDTIVLDECHVAQDIGRDVLGGSLTRGALFQMVKIAVQHANLVPAAAAQLREQIVDLFDDLHAHRNSPQYDCRLREPHFFPTVHAFRPVLAQFEEALGERVAKLSDGDDPAVRRANAKKLSFLQRAQALASSAAMVLKHLDELHPNGVVSLEEHRGDETKVVLRLLDVSQHFQKVIVDRFQAVILCSATATTNGDFTYLETSLGLPADRLETLEVPSPFDFHNHGLLITPTHMPAEIHTKEYTAALVETSLKIVEASRGRALFLFTSWANLRPVADALRRQNLVRVYQQNDMPKVQLVDAFRKDKHSVLLGVESMWTGLDIQGESLSVLVIDKIPFPNLKDPVMNALHAQDPKGAFDRFYIPPAIIQLKQGVGRLIRAHDDVGVVVLLDPRLTTKNYGSKFLRSLPPFRRTDKLDEIECWLRSQCTTDEIPF